MSDDDLGEATWHAAALFLQRFPRSRRLRIIVADADRPNRAIEVVVPARVSDRIVTLGPEAEPVKPRQVEDQPGTLPVATPIPLDDSEQRILKALGNSTLPAKRLASRLGLKATSRLRASLSRLVRLGALSRTTCGYQVTEAGKFSLGR